MASINLDSIATKDLIRPTDILNMEVMHGKFGLSHKVGLSSMNNFFLSSRELGTMAGEIDGEWGWLDEFVYGKKDGGIMGKEEMDNKFFLKTDAKFYYRRLLTDEVMEEVCSEYATKKMLSSTIYMSQTKGQGSATELANALAWIAAVLKSQAVQNDTNIQLETMEGEVILDAGEQMAEGVGALCKKIAELKEALAAAEAAAAGGGGGGGGEGGEGGEKIKLLVSQNTGNQKWYVISYSPKKVFAGPFSTKDAAKSKMNSMISSNPSKYTK